MMTDQADLELSLLRTFLAVVRYGTMGQAATAFAITQAAISQRIRRLEIIIGRKLFSRGRDGVTLTAHGEMLVAHANRAIALSEEALARLRDAALSTSVRLGVSEEAALGQLMPTLKCFQRAHQDFLLSLTIDGSAKLEFLRAQGDLDVVVSSLTPTTATPIAEWTSQLAWFASSELPPYDRPLPLVLSHSMKSWREPILDSLRRAGMEWRIILEGASLDSTLTAVESGLGIAALLPESVRRAGVRELKQGTMPELPTISFGLFSGDKVLGRAPSLLASTLATFFKTATAEQVTGLRETRAWFSTDDAELEPIAIG